MGYLWVPIQLPLLLIYFCIFIIDLRKARKFGNVFQFIDDLDAMCDDGEFERSYKEIYPIELEMKKEKGYSGASFLDLDIKIVNNQFTIKLFDKRDSFPFSIVRMPFLSSNMPSKIFYSSLAAEILRIGRTTTTINDFCHSVSNIIVRMSRQGAKIMRIKNSLKKMFGRHFDTFKCFSPTADHFVEMLLQ